MTDTKTPGRTQMRRQAMLDAATELFLEKGYNETSLSDIVSRSKGSRSTLYELFGNKEGLLRAIIEEGTRRVKEALIFPNEDKAPTEEDLFTIGHSFFRAAVSPANVAMYRIVVTEGGRIPAIADLFMNSGPRPFKQRLADLFRKAQANGDFAGGAPEDLAQAFAGLVLGDFHLRCAIGQEALLGDAEAEQHVRRSIRIFLKGARG